LDAESAKKMHPILSTALGVSIGIILTIFLLWIATIITQYICGSRYFTPSDHIIKKRLFERLKKDAKMAQDSPDITLRQDI